MNHRNILLAIMTVIILTSCASAIGPQSSTPPINLIPMYGYPDIEKSAAQKKSDEKFIKSVVANSGTREKASKEFAVEGWRHFKGDTENAMRRFNQSWLLNPNYYQPYWGFGALLWAQENTDGAIIHYNKSLSLIDDNREKPRLLTDTARAYSKKGFTATDKIKSKEYFREANSLFNTALTLDPHYDNAYRDWPRSLYLEGNYTKAWEIVKKSHALGSHDFDPKFIEALSRKMPEPK